jgi:hypothetical protein
MTSFEEFKQSAIDNQNVFYDTTVGAVRLESPKAISVEGSRLPMDPDALNGMIDMFGIGKRFANQFDQFVGSDGLIEVMNRFRSALAANENKGLTLSIDPDQEVITGIGERKPRVSMEGFFQIVEDVLGRYDLDVHRFTRSSNGITVATKNEDRSVNIPHLEEESYKSGLEFRSDMGQMDFRYMLEREICTNGMTGMVPAEQLSLTSLKDRAVQRFYDGIQSLADQMFLPEDFRDKLERNIDTPASVAEVEDSFEVLKQASRECQNPSLLSHIPMHRIRAAYEDIGYPVDEMTRTERKNARTDISVHDLVNEITWVASHPEDADVEGFNIDSHTAKDMQEFAGDLFTKKTLDTQNLVPSAF